MTDEEILGSLRQDILHIPPLREPKLASYYEAQRQELVDQCIAKAIEMEGQEVTCYVTRKERRVPRAWWGWAYRLWNKYKKTAF